MQHFDIIIIGSGAGGGTMAYQLAKSGKKILIIERGGFLPREKDNWDTKAVFQKEKYHTKEIWKTNETEELHPGTGYWVGGNTKVYGAALFRLREHDFDTVHHYAGQSPEWPLKYKDFEPWYTMAEEIYSVHGKMGLDPTEPSRTYDYSYPPVSHEPVIQDLHDSFVKQGLNPFYIPLGIQLNENDFIKSACIRCDTCDGFPCLVHAKSDTEVSCINRSIEEKNVTLLTNAKVIKIKTQPGGKSVEYLDVEVSDGIVQYKADIFVLSAGAINSAALLLSSASDMFPNGLANNSGLVGRNFMKHHNLAMLAISAKPNPTIFQKTLAINDFYWGDDVFKFPMGHIQLMGKSNKDMLSQDAPFFTPDLMLDEMATHSIDWWLTGEDLPLPENRVQIKNGEIHLAYKDFNTEGFDRLVSKWKSILSDTDSGHHFLPHNLYLRKKIPLAGVAHQCGTTKFGTDPKNSVLDINCKAHDLDNLYVVDGGFFPSSGAVNPSLTIMANALRVGDHIVSRMK